MSLVMSIDTGMMPISLLLRIISSTSRLGQSDIQLLSAPMEQSQPALIPKTATSLSPTTASPIVGRPSPPISIAQLPIPPLLPVPRHWSPSPLSQGARPSTQQAMVISHGGRPLCLQYAPVGRDVDRFPVVIDGWETAVPLPVPIARRQMSKRAEPPMGTHRRWRRGVRGGGRRGSPRGDCDGELYVASYTLRDCLSLRGNIDQGCMHYSVCGIGSTGRKWVSSNLGLPNARRGWSSPSMVGNRANASIVGHECPEGSNLIVFLQVRDVVQQPSRVQLRCPPCTDSRGSIPLPAEGLRGCRHARLSGPARPTTWRLMS
jgi:hypothetical protein